MFRLLQKRAGLAETGGACENISMRVNDRKWLTRRAGAAAVDYVLILAVILPMVAFLMWAGPRMIRLAYELTSLLLSWPFL